MRRDFVGLCRGLHATGSGGLSITEPLTQWLRVGVVAGVDLERRGRGRVEDDVVGVGAYLYLG